MSFFKQSALLLIILGTVTFFGCERVNSPDEVRAPKGNVMLGGSIGVAELALPASLLPSRILDITASHLGNQIHCGLVRMDTKTLDVVPGIAESWSVDENGTSYVFNLRKGAKFHSDACFGNARREITASDFEYAFQELSGPEDGAYNTTFKGRVKGAADFHAGNSDRIEGIQVVDDYTLRIELIKPDPSFLFVLAQPSTAVISKLAHEKYGEKLKNGAGPFLFSETDNQVILIRNPDYFQSDAFGNATPYIDTLIFRFLETKELQLRAFFSGEVDLVTSLYLDPVREILEQHMAGFSGRNAKYVLQREAESAGYEVYSVHNANVLGFQDNFMSYWDFSQVQVAPSK